MKKSRPAKLPPTPAKARGPVKSVHKESKPRKSYVKPTVMKDGSPLIPWSVKVAAAIAKREAATAAGIPPKSAQYAKVCTAMTTGNHGPKRPCENPAVSGLEVCRVHGGSIPAVKAAAKRRILEEVDPTISRLREIRDQDEHMPSALGASIHILNRALGKPGDGEKHGTSSAPVINIGINIGGLPVKPTVSLKQLPVSSEEEEDEFEEGEVVKDNEDEDDYDE